MNESVEHIGPGASIYVGRLLWESVCKSVARQDAELQAITGMCQTAPFAVWERLLQTDSQGSLSTLANPRSVFFPGSSVYKRALEMMAYCEIPAYAGMTLEESGE